MEMEKIKVLQIEDNASHARLFQEILGEIEEFKLELKWVTRLADGISLLGVENFDVVLLDLSLPDVGGLDSFNKLYAAYPDVPVIILTSANDERLAILAVRAGAQDYFFKGQVESKILSHAIRYAVERGKLIRQLKDALTQVKTLRGLLPICANCKKIRDDKGYWNQIELYIKEHSDAEFTHSLCPDCIRELYPELADEVEKKLAK
jgi:DNA-binding NtrC family response regulator